MTPTAASVVQVPLRWVDLDAQGHANNAAIVDYLQEARVAFLLNGPNAHLLGDGVIVVSHQIEYLSPIDFSHTPLETRLWVGHVGASVFILGYELFQQGTPVARARTRACVFDFDLGRPIRMKADERAWFASFSNDLEPLHPLGKWAAGESAHEFEFPVRWSDLDSYGHVNNTRFFDYTAEARVALVDDVMVRAAGPAAAASPAPMWLVARQDMDYLAQLDHRLDPYLVRTSVVDVGRTSTTLVAEISDPLTGTIAARALTVLVQAGPDGRPQPIPDAVCAELRRWPATSR